MPRVKRRARNQALFRQVNENIAEVSARFDTGTQAYICECSHVGCTERINVPVEVYGRVRSSPTSFVVMKGHEDLGHELVVEDLGELVIVETTPRRAIEAVVDTP